MDTFAALALTTDPASISLSDRKPDTHRTRLFSADTIRMILGRPGQSICQVITILIFHFLGPKIVTTRVQYLRLCPDLQLGQLQKTRQQAQYLRGHYRE